MPFGEGDLPFEGLIRTLKGAGYDGSLVVELEDPCVLEFVQVEALLLEERGGSHA